MSEEISKQLGRYNREGVSYDVKTLNTPPKSTCQISIVLSALIKPKLDPTNFGSPRIIFYNNLRKKRKNQNKGLILLIM